MSSKKTLVLGATTNSSRYAYKAVNRLLENIHEVVPVGIKKGEVGGITIVNDLEKIHEGIDTITLYLGPKNQVDYYDYILETNPKRVIFNPGTFNVELVDLLKENSIETVDACTLVMLSADTY
jgi:predicted CoA-binding protein